MSNPRNVGDQVRDAIQDAIDSQDYSNLRSTVERSINTAASAIESGLRQAAQAAQDKRAQQNATRAYMLQREQERLRREQEIAAAKARFASVSGKKVAGFAMAIGGGFLALSFLASALLFVPMSIMTASAGVTIALGVLLCCGAASIGLSVAGVKSISFLQRFKKYQGVLASREACPIGELSAQTARPERLVLKDVRKMIGKGLFLQGHVDDAGTWLMVTDASYQNYRHQLAEASSQRARLEQQAAARKATEERLSGEARAILKKGEAYIAQIRKSNDAIPGEEISAKIDQIESVVRSIFKRAEEHPEVISELDRLMDYYLPTTVKLLDAYEDLDRQPIQGDNIAKSKAEIEATLDTLSIAFERLLDSIFTDVAWDVSTDVSVLHAVLTQEGLVEDPFASKRKPSL